VHAHVSYLREIIDYTADICDIFINYCIITLNELDELLIH